MSAPRPRRRQSGFALLFVLVVVVLGVTYAVLNQLNAAPSFTPQRRDHNARVLNQAKQALIGYVAMKAGQSGEDDPGRLPCPEAAGDYGDPAREGIAGPNCLTAVGRLPWRTLGLDRLTDAHGEPLWYVVSPGWHKPDSTTNTVINSNTIGQLTVDGLANDAVALIIAPGAPLISSAPGCAGVTQARSLSSINVVNYLDCDNATPSDASFTTNGPAGSFNDQVLRITARDVIPAIEAAIAARIEREIVPAMRSVYATGWGSAVTPSDPFYPYAAPFADPASGASFKGSASSCALLSPHACQGLLPAVYINDPAGTGVCATATGSACDPNFVRWTGGSIQVREVTFNGIGTLSLGSSMLSGALGWNVVTTSCSVVTIDGGTPRAHTALSCDARVPGIPGVATSNIRYRIQGTALNVGMAFRTFDTTGYTMASGPSATMDDGSGTADITFDVRMNLPADAGIVVSPPLSLCGFSVFSSLPSAYSDLLCRRVTVTIPITIFGDAPIVNARHATLGWFARNEWYRVLYYATARGVTPARGAATPNCIQSDNECLQLDAQVDKRALLLLAGRSLQGTIGHTRTALDDFLESQQNRDTGRRFETRRFSSDYNDRAMVVQVD